MSTVASQITSLMIVYTTFYSGADQRKHQISASLAFVRGIHRWLVNSSHEGPVMRKMFPINDVIMYCLCNMRRAWGPSQYKDMHSYQYINLHYKDKKVRWSHNCLYLLMKITILGKTIFILRQDPGVTLGGILTMCEIPLDGRCKCK